MSRRTHPQRERRTYYVFTFQKSFQNWHIWRRTLRMIPFAGNSSRRIQSNAVKMKTCVCASSATPTKCLTMYLRTHVDIAYVYILCVWLYVCVPAIRPFGVRRLHQRVANPYLVLFGRMRLTAICGKPLSVLCHFVSNDFPTWIRRFSFGFHFAVNFFSFNFVCCNRLPRELFAGDNDLQFTSNLLRNFYQITANPSGMNGRIDSRAINNHKCINDPFILYLMLIWTHRHCVAGSDIIFGASKTFRSHKGCTHSHTLAVGCVTRTMSIFLHNPFCLLRALAQLDLNHIRKFSFSFLNHECWQWCGWLAECEAGTLLLLAPLLRQRAQNVVVCVLRSRVFVYVAKGGAHH